MFDDSYDDRVPFLDYFVGVRVWDYERQDFVDDAMRIYLRPAGDGNVVDHVVNGDGKEFRGAITHGTGVFDVNHMMIYTGDIIIQTALLTDCKPSKNRPDRIKEYALVRRIHNEFQTIPIASLPGFEKAWASGRYRTHHPFWPDTYSENGHINVGDGKWIKGDHRTNRDVVIHGNIFQNWAMIPEKYRDRIRERTFEYGNDIDVRRIADPNVKDDHWICKWCKLDNDYGDMTLCSRCGADRLTGVPEV